MQFDEHKTHGMVVFDGNRLVARAVRVRGGWRVKAYGFYWTDQKARNPNALGKVAPEFIILPNRKAARQLLKSL